MSMYDRPPYYITAYGLAVKQGFTGSLNEWLTSLHGNNVELRFVEDKLQWRWIRKDGMEIQEEGNDWQDLIDMSGTREEIFSKAQQEVDKAVTAAGRSEAAATRSENAENEVKATLEVVSTQAGRSEAAAGRAEAAADKIVVDQEYIDTQVFSAGAASGVAAAAAADAAASEEKAKSDADRAEEAAGRAEEAASTDPNRHAEFFTITDDGVISLKPEYRGAIPSTKYPYAISDNGQGVAGSKNSELPEVIAIPEVVNEIAVTAFPIGVFAYNTAVQSITIPTFITEIPQIFAREAINLHTINGTENVKVLGKQAFYRTAIEKANFPNLEELVEGNQFQYCANLIYANIGNKITAIPSSMFGFCEKLSCVRNSENVVSVGASAFTRTKRLKNLPFLPNLTQIGDAGFRYSRINYDWESLSGCTFGAMATALQWNPTDFWSACTYADCKTTLRTTFTQHDPRWANDEICNVSGITWGESGCMPTGAAMIYSAFENKELASPKEFVEAVKAANPSLMDLNPRQDSNMKQWLEAVGYTVEYKTYSDSTLQEMYDALKTGALILAGVDGNLGTASFEGHAAVFYGVNENGEILVLDATSEGKMLGNHNPVPYSMPIQNMSAMGDGFLIVTKN